MSQALENILEEFTINSASTIQRAVEPLVKHFNIDIFYHIYVNSNGDYWWTSNQEACSRHIVDNQLCLSAPHIIHPDKILTSYIVPEKLSHIPFYKKFVTDHMDMLNGHNLFLLVKKYHDYYEIYTFGSTQAQNDCENFYASPHLQQKYIEYFLNCTTALRKKAQSQCFNLVDNKAKFFNAEESALVPHIHVNNYECFLHDTTHDVLQEFTCREIDCLRALLAGKTANATAEELNISPRTVETYINNIRSKLGVKYKSEIIAKLVSDKSYESLFSDF